MDCTEQEWQLLMARFAAIEKKLDSLNGLQLWKAKVTGALSVLTFLTAVGLWKVFF